MATHLPSLEIATETPALSPVPSPKISSIMIQPSLFIVYTNVFPLFDPFSLSSIAPITTLLPSIASAIEDPKLVFALLNMEVLS